MPSSAPTIDSGGTEQARQVLPEGVVYATNACQCVDVLVVITDETDQKPSLIVLDLRNIFHQMQKIGSSIQGEDGAGHRSVEGRCLG